MTNSVRKLCCGNTFPGNTGGLAAAAATPTPPVRTTGV